MPNCRRLSLPFIVVLALTGCTSEQTDSPEHPSPTATSASSELEVVAQELEAPWSLAFHKGVTLVSERDSGRILELDDHRPARARSIATLEGVAAEGEGGLLGLAVDDDYLFAFVTAASGNEIRRYPLSGSPGHLSLGEPEVILDGIASAGFHNGGRLAFGPDGMHYATVGDAGNRDAAQDRDSLSGSILRMESGGGVPADNPFEGSLVYSYGHRNPQGLDWTEDGTMYASEFGQDTWDELNVIEAGGNYGWPLVEGIADEGSTEGEDLIDPVQQWSPDEASPSGIAVSHDSILVANLRGESLRRVPLSDTADSTVEYTDEFGRIRDVATTPEGEVLLLTNNTDGRGDPADGDDRILRIP